MENYPIGVLLHNNDQGHISKNLKSKLADIFGKGNRYGQFVGRIHRWFNYCRKKSEQEVETENSNTFLDKSKNDRKSRKKKID